MGNCRRQVALLQRQQCLTAAQHSSCRHMPVGASQSKQALSAVPQQQLAYLYSWLCLKASAKSTPSCCSMDGPAARQSRQGMRHLLPHSHAPAQARQVRLMHKGSSPVHSARASTGRQHTVSCRATQMWAAQRACRCRAAQRSARADRQGRAGQRSAARGQVPGSAARAQLQGSAG